MIYSFCLVLYVENDQISLTQIQHIISDPVYCGTMFQIVVKNEESIKLFESYGTVYILNNDKNFRQKNIYNNVLINEANFDFLIEIENNYFIDRNYLNEICLQMTEYNGNIMGSCCKITHDNSQLLLNMSKDKNNICCKCFRVSQLNNNDSCCNNNSDIESQMISYIMTKNIYYFGKIDSSFYISKYTEHDKLYYFYEMLKTRYNPLIILKGIYNIYANTDNGYKFKNNIMEKYNLQDYSSKIANILFTDLKTKNDMDTFMNHYSYDTTLKKYILWKNKEDLNILLNSKYLQQIRDSNNVKHYVPNETIQIELLKCNINSEIIPFTLMNDNLFFAKIDNNFTSNRILFDDSNNYSDNESKNYIKKLTLCLESNYEIIIKSSISENHVEIYQSCFMGIKLFNNGTVDFMEHLGLLGLPVISDSNFPNTILCDPTIEIIRNKVNYIHSNYQNKKLIISKSMHRYINEEMPKNKCIIIPSITDFKKDNTIINNINVILQREDNLIVTCNTHDELMFCKKINKSNFHYIDDTQVLKTNAKQKYVEFSKMFYPFLITISDLSYFMPLNYVKNICEKFDKTNAEMYKTKNIIGGILDSNLITIIDDSIEISKFISYKYTLLNLNKWQNFIEIDNCDPKIKFNALENDPNLFLFKYIKNIPYKNYMNLCKYHQLIYAKTNLELDNALSIDYTYEPCSKYAFITFLDDKLQLINPKLLKSKNMAKSLNDQCDIIDIRDLTNHMLSYQKLFIDGYSMDLQNTKMTNEKLKIQMKKIQHYSKILIMPDMYDHIFDFENMCLKTDPLLSHEIQIKKFKTFLKEQNINHIIGFNDCPEFDRINTGLPEIKCYLINSPISNTIFTPMNLVKNYDILIYLTVDDNIYSLTNRLKLLLQQCPFKIKIVESKTKMTDENLAKIINESWICIGNLSESLTMPDKYTQIALCGTVICGDMTQQSRYKFYHNTIEINSKMSDYEIIRILTYYVNNKNILTHMSNPKLLKSNTHSYVEFNINIKTLFSKINNYKDTSLEYNIQKQHRNMYQVARFIHNDKEDFIHTSLDYNYLPHTLSMFHNICFGSFNDPKQLYKIKTIFGCQCIDKEFIIKKRRLNVSCEYLIMLDYLPEYENDLTILFSQFSKVIIITTKQMIEHPYNVIQCNNINIPMPISNMIEPTNITTNTNMKYIACFVDLHLSSLDKLISIAELLPLYTFYTYGDLCVDNINSLGIFPQNIKLLKTEIDDFSVFMKDKCCSMKITEDLEECIMGIESMLIGKPFLYNHDMKFAEKITDDPNEIINNIINLTLYSDEKHNEICEHYLNINSTKNFERNVNFYCKNLTNKIDLMLNIIDKHFYNETLIINVKVNNSKRYCVYIEGKTSENIELLCNGKEIDLKYSKMESYLSKSFIDFVPKIATVSIMLKIKSNISQMLDISEFKICEFDL